MACQINHSLVRNHPSFLHFLGIAGTLALALGLMLVTDLTN